jgi:hypothetical protein
MTDVVHLRAVVVGLLGFAAAEEEMLLTVGSRGGSGAWAAVPLLAHTAEFKAQQSERLRAVRAGRTPPGFGEIDHASPAVYAAYASRPPGDVVRDLRTATADLADGVRALADEDLLDPSRHPWLHGRTLWLQVIVRGFWHPTGHIADYYVQHRQPDRAVALQSHALATARYLGAPDQAVGMACYGLACAQAVCGLTDAAAETLASAIALNPDIRANASRDPDLAPLRDSGRLARLLGLLGCAYRLRAPGPSLPSASLGLTRWQAPSDRHPQPMQPVRRSRSRCSWLIRSSRSARHRSDSRAQSARVGVLFAGSPSSASLMRLSGIPTRWDARMNATRRSIARG